MLLGRRKSGFTEEQVLRPSEIPDYVNEENDTTFARPKSACMGHEAPAAPNDEIRRPEQAATVLFVRQKRPAAKLRPAQQGMPHGFAGNSSMERNTLVYRRGYF